jgi:hypothetical protein
MHEHGLHSQTCFKKSQNHLKQGISSIIMQHSALWVIARTVWDLGLRDDCPLRPLRQRRVAWISRCRNALRHRHTVRVGLFLCRADRIQPASSGRCERRYTSARTAKRGGGGQAERFSSVRSHRAGIVVEMNARIGIVRHAVNIGRAAAVDAEVIRAVIGRLFTRAGLPLGA